MTLQKITPSASSGATAAVRAENLSFAWPGGWFNPPVPLFSGLEFDIFPGELVGLTGPSGKGKSTLGDILLGTRQATTGQVLWQGHPAGEGTGPLRCRYQKIFQDPVASFPPRQILAQAFGDVIRYHGLKVELGTRLSSFGLDPAMLKRYPHQLSGGEMQRMALARVMLLDPCFIVADEPTSRLDLSVQALIIRMISDFAKSNQCAVLLISHDQALIRAVCDRQICL